MILGNSSKQTLIKSCILLQSFIFNTMDASLKTQYDIKNNVEDLQRFIAELKTWETEIKEKEQSLTGTSATLNQDMTPPRNKKQKKTGIRDHKFKQKQSKIAGNDYRAWDKFDVAKACRDLDGNSVESNNDSSSNDECDVRPINDQLRKQPHHIPQTPENATIKDKDAERLKNIDLAFFEKEVGNKLVKEEKWKDAIECYSKAIKLDPTNQIYYANRALCHIKLSSFKLAEVDSTIALQLDKSYVKAYQRRAFARKALEQFEEAKSDYQQILLLEPKNALARTEIDRINSFFMRLEDGGNAVDHKPTFDHKKMFFSGDKTKHLNVENNSVVKKEAIVIESEKVLTTNLPQDSVGVQSIRKLPHQRSKCPLKKITVKQIENFSGIDGLLNTEIKKSINTASVATEGVPPAVKATATATPPMLSLPAVPETSVQFETFWKTIQGDNASSYRFLKSIPTGSLKSIFGSCLESWLVSQMLSTLASNISMRDPTFQYQFLLDLTKVDRFTSLALFLSPSDQQGILKCCDNLSDHYSLEAMAQLKKMYYL